MKTKDAQQLSGLTLAYLGDAAWEVVVREYLIEKGLTRPNDLHQHAVHFVSAEAQAKVADRLKEDQALTTYEISIFKRGRNSSPHSQAKNASMGSYRLATGFEALMGYLYLSDQERFRVLSQQCLAYVEEENESS